MPSKKAKQSQHKKIPTKQIRWRPTRAQREAAREDYKSAIMLGIMTTLLLVLFAIFILGALYVLLKYITQGGLW